MDAGMLHIFFPVYHLTSHSVHSDMNTEKKENYPSLTLDLIIMDEIDFETEKIYSNTKYLEAFGTKLPLNQKI